jgi:hypothetical protein
VPPAVNPERDKPVAAFAQPKELAAVTEAQVVALKTSI